MQSKSSVYYKLCNVHDKYVTSNQVEILIDESVKTDSLMTWFNNEVKRMCYIQNLRTSEE